MPLRKLATDRLRLAPFEDSDFDEVLALWQDPDYQVQIGATLSPLKARFNFDRFVKAADEADYGYRTVRHADGGGFLGECGLQERHLAEGSHIEVVCALVPHARGNGYASEAIRAVLREAFTHRNLETIIGVVKKTNRSSLKMIYGLGFRFWKPLDTSKDEDIFAVTRGALSASHSEQEEVG